MSFAKFLLIYFMHCILCDVTVIGRHIVFSGLVYKLLECINCVSREIACTLDLEMAGQKQANKYVLLYTIIQLYNMHILLCLSVSAISHYR